MQRKPVLIIAAIAVIGICAFLFVRGKYLVKPKDTEVIAFLDGFNADVNAGDPDSLFKYFDSHRKAKTLNHLLNLMCNKTGSDGNKPLFYVSLDTHQSEIKLINAEIVEAKVPVQFTEKINSGNVRQTILLLRLRKVSAGVFKITRIDGRVFYKDYIAYENDIRPIDNSITYSPETLEAFKKAEQLKSKYDTVVWFHHLNQKTYYYVVKGGWKHFYYSYENGEKAKDTYKMGLVDPDLKEIIPVEYDLVHNVGGTIAGMIEVEKGDKRGLYNLTGKIMVPVTYDQIMPLKEGDNLAVLRNGDDYFYLKKDTTITDKITNLDISAMLRKTKWYGDSYDMAKISKNDVMEYNSKDEYASIMLPPSYLVDWNVQPHLINLPNPLRKATDEMMGMSSSYEITFEQYKTQGSWYETIFNTIKDNYVDARSGLYEHRNVVMVDKKHNQIVGYDINTDNSRDVEGGTLSGTCNELTFRAVNDSLFELKTTAFIGMDMKNGKFLSEAPAYHYLYVNGNKLREYPTGRLFNFTRYVKMDESYLHGCFVYNDKPMGYVSDELLQYMKNEIFAEYNYKFKNQKWVDMFENRFNRYNATLRDDVSDSLTAIDTYNIAWINKKLKTSKINTSRSAE
ncbi:WG repeat-containing protein [Mucilaginibacter sp. AW1-3]